MLNESAKVYYSISEVCEQTGLEPHVLRYWESEFAQLRPKKNRAGNRAYREKDIRVIHDIKRLLYEEKFTIPGARKKLAGSKVRDEEPESDGGAAAVTVPEAEKTVEPGVVSLRELKDELGQVLRMLQE
jgi:DNA-binding transcriptional MerR regulator